jgi:hypothetical protein
MEAARHQGPTLGLARFEEEVFRAEGRGPDASESAEILVADASPHRAR